MDRLPRNQLDGLAPMRWPVLAAYVATLAFLFAASFLNQYRWWGFSWWGYFPIWVRAVLIVMAALLPWLLNPRPAVEKPDSRTGPSWGSLVVLVLVVFEALFVVLRTRMHLLGDGFQLLARLANDAPPIRPWNPAVYFLQDNLYALLGSGGDADALAAFRIISWTAGFLFVAALLWTAERSFDEIRERLAFVLVMATGGQALVFFGYVENYPMFLTLIGLMVLSGWMAAEGRLQRWWAFVPLVPAALFHPFTIAMVPPLGYLALRDTAAVRWYDRRSTVGRIGFWVAVVAPLAGVIYWLQSDISFLRFSLVPWATDRFTVEGYTLLSLNHLADWANLVFMFAPALLMYLAAWSRRDMWSDTERHGFRFLLLAIVPSLAIAFIFDPKLGMARDWDIFAFGAIPLNLAGVCLLRKTRYAHGRQLLVMAGVLSVMVLAPRVLVQTSEKTAVAFFNDIANLDPTKNRSGGYVLLKYYDNARRAEDFERTHDRYAAMYPQDTMSTHGENLFLEGKLDSSDIVLRRVISIDPTYFAAWANLGVIAGRRGQHDSAEFYLQIADALNPYNSDTYNNLGGTYFEMGRYDEAERWWKKSWALNKETFTPVAYLLRLYAKQRRRDDYIAMMAEACALPKAPAGLLREYAEYLAAMGRFTEAEANLRRALAAGIDTAAVRQAQQRYPDIKILP